MQSAVTLSVIVLNVVILSVVAPLIQFQEPNFEEKREKIDSALARGHTTSLY
jgi:hypothetical protein